MGALLLPVFASKNLRAWPGHDEGGAAGYQLAAGAFLERYATDAHTAAYSAPRVLRRLDKGAPGQSVDGSPLVVPVAFLFVDVDGADHKANPAWRQSEAAKIARALAELPGGFCYQTRGGYRLVWRLAQPFPVTGPDDAARWRLHYWRALLSLSRRFAIEGDPACSDWTRLYRLPHATRPRRIETEDGEGAEVPGDAPEELPTEGDPGLAPALAFEPDPADLALDLAEARRLAALYPATTDDAGKTTIAAPWGAAVKALASEAGEGEPGGGAASLPLREMLPATGPGAASQPRSSSSSPRPAPSSRRPSLEERQRLWTEKALERMADELARTTRGGRNNLARNAALILGHYAPHLLHPTTIERVLMTACERNGLVRDDGRAAAETTIRSAISDGMNEPKWPEISADEPRQQPSRPDASQTNNGGAMMPDQTTDERPVVLVDFETGTRIRETEAALAARGDLNLYVRDGRLVCVEAAAQGKRQVWRDDAGTPLARDLSLAALRALMTDCVRFERLQPIPKSEGGGTCRIRCRPHDDIVRGLHGATGWPELRDLVGIVRAPFLGSLAGAVATSSGYHEHSGYLLALPPGCAVSVPACPTRGDALAALAELKQDLFADFPFATEQDRSAALAALLTLQARPALGSNNVPAFLFEANVPSAGKTLLADVISLVGAGALAPKHAFTSDDREMDKTLGGLASEARALVCFDNIIEPIGGAALDRAITCNGAFSYRLLGQNRTVQSAWRAVMFFTANNASIGGDIGRRLMICRLESPEERPGLRQNFRHEDLRAYATEHRARFAGLALTILRAFCLLPREQRPGVAALGSFEAWAKLVAGALVWLGEADPIGAVADDRAGGVDPIRAALGLLLAHWNGLETAERSKLRWGPQGLGVKAALEALYPGGNPGQGDGLDELREALEVLAQPPAGKTPVVRQVGNALARVRERVVGGRKLLGVADRKGVMVWRVVEARGGASAGSAGSCRVSSTQAEDKGGGEGDSESDRSPVPKGSRETTRQDPADPAGTPTPPPVSGVSAAPGAPANEAGEYVEDFPVEGAEE